MVILLATPFLSAGRKIQLNGFGFIFSKYRLKQTNPKYHLESDHLLYHVMPTWLIYQAFFVDRAYAYQSVLT